VPAGGNDPTMTLLVGVAFFRFPYTTLKSQTNSMIILGLLLLLSRNDWSQALPLYHRAGPLLSPDETPSTRTILSIVWSCLLTVVICAWTSVHPNVPPQHQGRAFWRRIGVLFWTVIAPELILAWAVRQWFAAREIRDIYNRYRGVYKSSYLVLFMTLFIFYRKQGIEAMEHLAWSLPCYGGHHTCERRNIQQGGTRGTRRHV